MTTVKSLIERIMPRGTRPGTAAKGWHQIPISPIDVFAVAAVLVERSGCYRYVAVPQNEDDPTNSQLKLTEFQEELSFVDQDLRRRKPKSWTALTRAWSYGLHPGISRSGENWEELYSRYKNDLPEIPRTDAKDYYETFHSVYIPFNKLIAVDMNPLQDIWRSVYRTHGAAPVVSDNRDKIEDWWLPVLKLLILSDSAAQGVGFRRRVRGGREGKETLWQAAVLAWSAYQQHADPENPYFNTVAQNWVALLDYLRRRARKSGKDDEAIDTAPIIDPTFCAVMPKTRTASLGCTLRSLSHNLALLPSPGLVEARWRVPGEEPYSPLPTGKSSPTGAPHAVDHPEFPSRCLNLLLIPFPYRISSKCFRNKNGEKTPGSDWGYFETNQKWLPHERKQLDDLERFFGDLAKDAAEDLKGDREQENGIHGVLFPEFALDRPSFDSISKHLIAERDQTGFEFLVAGLSEEPIGNGHGDALKKGNFVAVRGVEPKDLAARDPSFTSAREKHHRWKLNQSQIERYGLSSSLDPTKNWWEAIPISRRVVDFFEPRAGTSMTVLICEDLARADPCQTVVRSVGPNLVLALLMDGPQRKFRWPGHYAGVLADDPGSSVLTLTSFGLVAKGAAGDPGQSRSIALFRNSIGQERELFLPSGFHALVVRLKAVAKTEHTLDGRGDGAAAFIWKLHEVNPVRGRLTDSNRWITEGAV